jgi:two-component system, OmpR family, sensor histidine kinase KdpD
MSRMTRPWGRIWPPALNLGATHPLLGASMGLALVAVLVPVLYVFHGEDPRQTLYPSIPLFFLVPVLLASAIGGQRAGVLVSCAAIFTWDWFFIPPLYTVTIYYPRDLLALVVFLAVALLVGQLATATRRRAEEALRRARSSEALYDLSLALIARRDLSEALPALLQRLRATFDLEACAVVLPDEWDGSWHTTVSAGHLPSDLRVEASRNVAAVAGWVHEHGQMAALGYADRARRWAGPKGPDTDAGPPFRAGGDGRVRGARLLQGRAQFLPLRVGTRAIGVLELVYKANAPRDADREHLLETFANGAAIALEQQRLVEEEQAAAVARESDRLKSALLSSVSHDLRTPLAGIKAAASSLLQQDVQWSEEDRRAFLADIDAEADRLTRLVSNLLDLSRIEAGAIRPQKDWEDVGELIDRVTRRLAPRLAGHPLSREVSAELPPVRLDTVQIEQALTNLIENAAKYAPPESPITVGARVVEGPAGAPELHLVVIDRGVGIPQSEQANIFDKFYRVAGSAARIGGTGMGLAIVKGLVEAHGGRVTVESTPGEGSTFTVNLPAEPQGRRPTPLTPEGSSPVGSPAEEGTAP